MGFYDYNVKGQVGEDISLADYKGKVLIVVNSATQCGFTPQYEGLEEIYNKYKDKGLEILEFPCNQFGEQAPGSADEINEFCKVNYNVTFKRFKKIDVNGEGADPLFKFLYKEKPFKGFDKSTEGGKDLDKFVKGIRPDYEDSDDIKWNFTKFVIDKQGNVIARFEPTEGLEPLENVVKDLL